MKDPFDFSLNRYGAGTRKLRSSTVPLLDGAAPRRRALRRPWLPSDSLLDIGAHPAMRVAKFGRFSCLSPPAVVEHASWP